MLVMIETNLNKNNSEEEILVLEVQYRCNLLLAYSVERVCILFQGLFQDLD